MYFWLHHTSTAHCIEKTVSACLSAGSTSADRVGQEEVGGVTHSVLFTWWLLGLALKRPWLGPGRPPRMDGVRKHYSRLAGSWFLARLAAWALSGCMTTHSADYCMLVNEWP